MRLFVKLAACIGLVPMLTGCGDSSSEKTETTYHNVFVTEPRIVGGSAANSYPATVEEARDVSVGFKTAGQIVRVLAKEGDHVRAGQLLAVLDTVDYALGVNQLRVQYRQMISEFERQKQLHATGNMSDNDFEKAQAGLRQLGLQLKLNENKLAYCRLYAPASGVITKRNFEASEMVDAGTPVFELMDNSHLEVVVDLPVNAYLHRDKFRGFEGRSPHTPGMVIPLNMISLTPRADNNQLYRLKLWVGEGGAHITPGQDLTVTILTEGETLSEGNGTPMAELPLSSILERDGKPGVWLLQPKDSTVHFTPVVITGSGEGGTVTVTGALDAASQVVRAGVHHLTDGEKVKVLHENSSTNPGNIL